MGKLIKIIIVLIIIFVLFFLLIGKVAAIENPLAVPNNRFGIHITNEHDLENAANLVNSSGGQWGYVTFVIREDEKDTKRWQRVMDKMRQLKLIPLVRVATFQGENSWDKPSLENIDAWVNFFESLNWVVKNRYIIIGNEPNHGKEWGGEISPEEYAVYLKTFSESLKRVNDDYYILPAGFDASAPNGRDTMDQVVFIRRMLEEVPDIFEHLDGWTSHSYPNPAFSGEVTDIGRGTIRTFEWELSLLKSFGIGKKFPVFITETGWAHNMNGNVLGLKNTQDMGQKLVTAFETVWNNENVVAVTPFILNYREEPFRTFSWTSDDGAFYPSFELVKAIPKEKGRPVQISSARLVVNSVSPYVQISNYFRGFAIVQNTGQSIWEPGELKVVNDFDSITYLKVQPETVEPGEKTMLTFSGRVPDIPQDYETEIFILRGEKLLTDPFRIHLTVLDMAEPVSKLVQLRDSVWETILKIFYLR